MKKIFFAFAVIMFFLPITITLGAGASTLSISGPTKANVMQSLSINVVVHPNGEGIDTIRAMVTYPGDLIRIDQVVNSSTYPNQSPANTFGNGNISWGGFRTNGPNIDTVTFATIKATALKPGTATLTISGNSRIISKGEERSSGANGSLTIVIGEKLSSSTPSSPSSPSSTSSSSSLICASHPEENMWYNNRELHCSLTNKENKLDVELIKDNTTVWKTSLNKTNSEFTVPLSDGAYDILVNTKETRTVLIDTTAPKSFYPTVERLSFGEDITVYFATTDTMSGIDHYSFITADTSEQVITSPFVMKSNPTNNILTIIAWDKAGNSTAATLSIVNREVISWTYWAALFVSLLLWAYILGKLHERKIRNSSRSRGSSSGKK